MVVGIPKQKQAPLFITKLVLSSEFHIPAIVGDLRETGSVWPVVSFCNDRAHNMIGIPCPRRGHMTAGSSSNGSESEQFLVVRL